MTGATGKQGGAVARKLVEAGWRVRALVRKPNSAKLPSGVEAVQGNQEDLDSLKQAVSGAYGVFSVQPLVKGDPDREVAMGLNVLEAARWSVVQHFVYSSAMGAGAPTVPHFRSKGEIERAVRQSGLRYTIFRPAGFMENLLLPQSRKAIAAGKLELIWSERVEAWWIAVNDIGEFVKMAFEQPERLAGAEMDLAGDRRDGAEAAAILSRVLNRPVTVSRLPRILVRLFAGADIAAMCDWMEEQRVFVDLGALRVLHPGMLTLEGWARKQNWNA